MTADLTAVPANRRQRDTVVALMREHLGDELQAAIDLTGMTWDQFVEMFETSGEVRALVRDGADVGYYWIEPRGRALHLHAVFVLPEFRSQGIGAAAIGGLEREFRHRCDFIELGVRGDNVRARAFYTRLGFVETSRVPHPSFVIMRRPMSREP